MILSDASLKKLIKSGELKISPFDISQIQPSSIDLTLSEELLFYVGPIDVKSPQNPTEVIKIPKDGFEIPPKAFMLASTREYIQLPDNLTAFVEGRSSLGRLGLFIQNAGWVDAGFEGQLTLELYNANSNPIRIYSGIRICQIVIAKLEAPCEKPYSGKYKNQKGPTPSRVYLDFQSSS
ncbi:MAG: dCTP deaminase [Aquificaceae bacterium]